MTSRIAGLVCLALAAGCSKKPAAAAAASATAVRALPPGAVVYAEINVKAALGSKAFEPFKAMMLAGVPQACAPVVDAASTLSLALYGNTEEMLAAFSPRIETENGEPSARPAPKMVAVLTGPTTADLRRCMDDTAEREQSPIETETRAGKEILRLGGGKAWLFATDDTTHVVATTADMLNAALAAAAGGPSLSGAAVLSALSAVPPGSVMFSGDIPPDAAAALAKGFPGGTAPVPRIMTVSVALDDPIAINAAATMADETSAQALEGLVNGGLAMIRTAMGVGGGAGQAEKMWKPVLDGVSVARAGATLSVRASVPASILPTLMIGSRGGRPQEVRVPPIEPAAEPPFPLEPPAPGEQP